jgi:hypothetical protein
MITYRERLRCVANTHHNMAVLRAVVDVGELLKDATLFEGNVEGVVADDGAAVKALEKVGRVVLHVGEDTVLGHVQALDLGTVLDTKTLHAEADTEDGKELLFAELPQVRDDSDVRRYGRGPRTGADNDGIEGLQVRAELLKREVIVMNDVDLRARDGINAQRRKTRRTSDKSMSRFLIHSLE